MTEQEFAADLAEAREEAAQLESEIRQLRRDKAGRGAIAAARWQLKATTDWLWQVRFAAWTMENGDEDAIKEATFYANRGEGPVPF